MGALRGAMARDLRSLLARLDLKWRSRGQGWLLLGWIIGWLLGWAGASLLWLFLYMVLWLLVD